MTERPNTPKPDQKPAQVDEPDPVRPPNEPTPKNPQKPEEFSAGEGEEERPETQGQ